MDHKDWEKRKWDITGHTGNHYLGTPSLPLSLRFTKTATGVRISLSAVSNWHSQAGNGTARDAVAGSLTTIPNHTFDIASVGSLLRCTVWERSSVQGGEVASPGSGAVVVGGWTAEDGGQLARDPTDRQED